MKSCNSIYTRYKNLFYPGGIWMRRCRHLMVVSLIGTNLFINDLQDRLLIAAEQFVIHSEPLAASAVSVATYMEQSVLPTLVALEQPEYRWIGRLFSLPKGSTLQAGITNLKTAQRQLNYLGGALGVLSTILFWMFVILLISIVYSSLWLLFDLCLGNTRKFMTVMLLLSFLFNICSFIWLNKMVANFMV